MTSKFLITAFIICCCLACKKQDPIKVTQVTYPLPGTQFFPEGIAYDAKNGVFYTGSTISGDIVQVNVETALITIFASGAKQGRTFCTGMKLDAKGRLWVCGGPTSIIQVLDAQGNLLKTWDTKALFNGGFINDCIISDGYIYFTDSQVPKIYRASVTNEQPGNLEEWLVITPQQIPYVAGTNANGIEVTPDGKYLIAVYSNSGKLFKINISNKGVSEILLNTPVPSGDGLLLDGKTLYVSRNATGLIFPVTLNSDLTQGTVGTGFGENLIGNTTMVKAGKYILVVNGQLSRRGGTPPPVLPFYVSRVTIP